MDRWVNPNSYFPNQPNISYNTGDVFCTGI